MLLSSVTFINNSAGLNGGGLYLTNAITYVGMVAVTFKGDPLPLFYPLLPRLVSTPPKQSLMYTVISPSSSSSSSSSSSLYPTTHATEP